ncbi:monovalent cation/H+ antiporter complex subunit F [Rothia sp. AR01]|uniref:Monovalent cation/H+ antiporter complex subunit F n=1 Tax=Rothia santali TaxID=2949643 RepID=A0A9X2HAD0_9MICC|nr:monovalent cation/H+ antiporter complex subunit F [Rothia santali]MCP3425661.1 monovalent cation/H+ antiporter complex subunit F [Rothia santali]
MIAIDLSIVVIGLVCLVATYRMLRGPDDAHRAIAADLLMFGILGLIVLLGVRTRSPFTFDIVLIAALVAFLSAISLARALTRGKR